MPASGDAARHPGAGEHRGLELGGKVPSDAIKALVIRLGGVEAIIGHSFGAACALLALDNQQRLSNKLALIGCPPDGIWVTEQFGAILGVKAGTLARMRALSVPSTGGMTGGALQVGPSESRSASNGRAGGGGAVLIAATSHGCRSAPSSLARTTCGSSVRALVGFRSPAVRM